MSTDTLVLDSAMVPVSFTSRYRAIAMVYTKRAEVVNFDQNEIITSEKFSINIPRVIRLNQDFVKKFKRRVPFSKNNVMVRDSVNGRPQCQYCLKKMVKKEATFDHIIPKSKGGVSSWRNLVISCMPCNRRKGNMLPAEVGMFTFRDPLEPSIHDKRYNFKLSVENIREEWLPWNDYIHIKFDWSQYNASI